MEGRVWQRGRGTGAQVGGAQRRWMWTRWGISDDRIAGQSGKWTEEAGQRSNREEQALGAEVGVELGSLCM
jgi:hypothetical protein